jgi:hypothetical protein
MLPPVRLFQYATESTWSTLIAVSSGQQVPGIRINNRHICAILCVQKIMLLRKGIPKDTRHFIDLPTGCAMCTTFRHRHFRLRRLIETAQLKGSREDKPGDQEAEA